MQACQFLNIKWIKFLHQLANLKKLQVISVRIHVVSSLTSQTTFFLLYLDGEKGPIKWAVWIGDACLRIRISEIPYGMKILHGI